MTKVVGVDVGGTFTDVISVDGATGRCAWRRSRRPRRPVRRVHGRHPRRRLRGPRGRVARLARDDHRHQRGARAQGRPQRAHHDARLPRHRSSSGRARGRTLRPERQLRAADPARSAARGATSAWTPRAAVVVAARRGPGARRRAPPARRGVEALADPLHALVPNATHEQRAREIVREEWPNAYVTAGTELLPEFREFERGTTAAINAYIQPVIDRYFSALAGRLRDAGLRQRAADHAVQRRRRCARRWRRGCRCRR